MRGGVVFNGLFGMFRQTAFEHTGGCGSRPFALFFQLVVKRFLPIFCNFNISFFSFFQTKLRRKAIGVKQLKQNLPITLLSALCSCPNIRSNIRNPLRSVWRKAFSSRAKTEITVSLSFISSGYESL